MKTVNASNPIEILNAKNEIESNLISNGKLDSPMDLPTFVNWLSMQETIFIKDDNVIPFRIYEDYLFIAGDNNNLCEDGLKTINFDLSKLKEIPMSDVFDGATESLPFYIISNSKYYKA